MSMTNVFSKLCFLFASLVIFSAELMWENPERNSIRSSRGERTGQEEITTFCLIMLFLPTIGSSCSCFQTGKASGRNSLKEDTSESFHGLGSKGTGLLSTELTWRDCLETPAKVAINMSQILATCYSKYPESSTEQPENCGQFSKIIRIPAPKLPNHLKKKEKKKKFKDGLKVTITNCAPRQKGKCHFNQCMGK